MTEEIAATPGWVDGKIDAILAHVPAAARNAYAECLAQAKAPAAPSDMLGAEFARCRRALLAAIDPADQAGLIPRLEALEAEIAQDS